MASAELKPAADLAKQRQPRFKNESKAHAEARAALLAAEIEARRNLTRLARQRRALPPGPRVEIDYRFKDASGNEVGLKDLFGNHDTLVTYFWMYGPERERPCPMCTNFLGGVNGNAADIKQRAAFKILGRSPVERQAAFAKERGWRDLDFVQTVGDDYANDLGLMDKDANEFPGFTVYHKDGDGIRVFYSAEMPAEAADPGEDPRGAVDMAPLWNILDMTPEGRGKDWYPELNY